MSAVCECLLILPCSHHHLSQLLMSRYVQVTPVMRLPSKGLQPVQWSYLRSRAT